MRQIRKMIIHSLDNSRCTGTEEWESTIDIDLILHANICFQVAGIYHTITKIKVSNMDDFYPGDDIHFYYANEETVFKGLTIDNQLLKVVYEFLHKEEVSGELEGWYISDELKEFLMDEDVIEV